MIPRPNPATPGEPVPADAATPAAPCCALCGEPLPPGEAMFMVHGFSGPCPGPLKPPEPLKPMILRSIIGPDRQSSLVVGDFVQTPDGRTWWISALQRSSPQHAIEIHLRPVTDLPEAFAVKPLPFLPQWENVYHLENP